MRARKTTTMNCTICGQAAMPGAMLCQPCRAALKRARYVSVQELPPTSIIGAGRARRRKRAPESALRAPVVAVAPTAARSASVRRASILGGAVLAVLVVVAYLGLYRAVPVPPPMASPTPLVLARPASAPGPAMTGEVLPTLAAPTGKATSRAAVTMPHVAPSSTDARPVPAATPAVTAAASRATLVPAPAIAAAPRTPEISLDSFGPLPQVARVVAPAAPRAVSTLVRVRPPPDRWASLRSALAQCDREGGLSGFLCDQRVRIEGCEGYWGKVPDCPGPPENPGGQ